MCLKAERLSVSALHFGIPVHIPCLLSVITIDSKHGDLLPKEVSLCTVLEWKQKYKQMMNSCAQKYISVY